MGRKIIFISFIFISILILIPFISSEEFGYDTPEDLGFGYDTIRAGSVLGGFGSSYYMPNNKSVTGNFSFNGGWENNGCSIIDGDIYCQTGYFYNLTSLNVERVNLTVLDNLIIDGDVGIGTDSPTSALDLYVTGQQLTLDDGTKTAPGLRFIDDNVGIFRTNTEGLGFEITISGNRRFFVNTNQFGGINGGSIQNENPAVNNPTLLPSRNDHDTGIAYRSGNDFTLTARAINLLEVKGTAAGVGEVIINEDSNDVDFRVESNANTHALFVESSSGNVGIGTDSPAGALEIARQESDGIAGFYATTYDTRVTAAPFAAFRRSKSGTLGTVLETADDDALGTFTFLGANSNDAFARGGRIRFEQDGAAGATYVPSRIIFQTSDGTNDAADRLTIKSDGKIGINIEDPSSQLNIKQPTNDIVGGLVFTSSDSESSGIFREVGATGGLVFRSQSTDTLYVKGGNVGIGTPTPKNTLNVIGDFNVTENSTTTNIIPQLNNSYDLGSPTNIWKKLWANVGNFLGNVFIGGNLSVTGNVTANNVFLPVYVSSHTNNTIAVSGAGVWMNVTFDHGEDEFKKRITHNTDDATNITFTIQDTGIYEITYTMSFEDSAASPNAHVITRVTNNYIELNGFTIEKDSSKQNADFGLHHSDLVGLTAGDEIGLSFTSDDTTVSLTSHLTYGVHRNTGHFTMKRIA